MSSEISAAPDNTDEIFLFEAGTTLYALIEAARDVAEVLQNSALGGGYGHDRYFVPIQLDEDLCLLLKKPNRVELKRCKCSIQVPDARECVSLNHAYTTILQAYKPHLRTFTGNVFLTVYYERIGSNAQQDMFANLTPLNLLREEKVSEYEASLRFRRALTAALNFHREQTRKGGTIPYVSHVLAVTSIVQEYGGSEDEAIAALLHDGVDNGGGYDALDEIAKKFGPRIADIVLACTDTMTFPKPPWKERKEAFLCDLPNTSDSARLVIAADKLHNARCILAELRSQGARSGHDSTVEGKELSGITGLLPKRSRKKDRIYWPPSLAAWSAIWNRSRCVQAPTCSWTTWPLKRTTRPCSA